MNESIYTFIYLTVNTYRNFEEFILKKLHEKYHNNNQYEGYLINKKYFDYWRMFSNYEELKDKIRSMNYNDARDIIISYRKYNKIREYQQDAIQHFFLNSLDLYNKVKNDGNDFVLIDKYFWKSICADKDLNQKGGIRYIIRYNKIIILFSGNDNCEITTDNNIIDRFKDIQSKEIFLNNNNNKLRAKNNNFFNNKTYPNNNYKNVNNNSKNILYNSYKKYNYDNDYEDYNNHINYNDNNYKENNDDDDDGNFEYDEEKEELKKILLLYAFEQELKNKINNLKYRENNFKKYYLISKDWIQGYKKHYCYDEIKKLIQNKQELKNLLNNGYNEAKKNMHILLKKIKFSHNSRKFYPYYLKDNNEFISERGNIILGIKKSINYWKNFELVNEELRSLLSKSNINDYEFTQASFAKCLISGGKVIIDLSQDEENKYNYACEIGYISNSNMIYNDEFIFYYDNEQDKNRSIKNFKNDFMTFQKNNINLGVDLECEIMSNEGTSYGTIFKIPPHD